MYVELDRGAEAPLYQQIRDGLRGRILTRALQPGTRLPSSRQLAVDLGVSRITTATAYAELEAEGLVESRQGSGTYVLPPWRLDPAGPRPRVTRADEGPDWQARLRPTAAAERGRMLREAIRAPHRDDVVGFAWARGDVRLFPADELRRTLADVVHRDPAASLQYEQCEGYPPLRRAIAAYLRQLGIETTEHELLVTAGAQQAIDLIARALLEPGDRVAVERPTYPGAIEAFEAAGVEVLDVPLDREGMRLDGLTRALDAGARLIYTVPTFHNPTGLVASAARRRGIVALARGRGVPVLEDDYLREVRFGSPIPPPLAACDPSGNVIHVGSFSKSLLPALRLGYVVARGRLRDHLVDLKRVADAGSSALMQRALGELLQSGWLHGYWKRTSRVYRRRQAAMSAALGRHFPAGARWTCAAGGVVQWVRVPDGVSVEALFDAASPAGVSFAVGSAFFARPADQPFMRLNFAAIEEPAIERGIALLGRLLRQQIESRRCDLTPASAAG